MHVGEGRGLSSGLSCSGVCVMRFDVETFRQLFPELTSPTKAFAGGGVALATLIVGYGALTGTGERDAEAEARTTSVAVQGSVFKPVSTMEQQSTATTVAARRSSADAPPASRNLDDPRAIAHAVQTELKRAGCYAGPVNGIWSASTQKAMSEFAARTNARLPVDRADPVLLALVENNRDVTCGDGPPPAQSAELHTSSVTTDATTRPERLRYSEDDRRALDTLAAAEPEADADGFDATSAAGTAATAAAAGAAASTKAARPERRRSKSSRKYRQPSIARQVSRGFRQLQRDLNKIF